ncbi:hypothetical protein [cf. Phormidesmis sp. LEGE 11477]|uniref:hypothetical protein n=1 Tax=cf. Phormidesmis sp. LEGE 11477 TaxID=1828680 RepID=UPI001882B0B8|nr:hypothetical protein [cf. Phormidesmis sp. LEGE 11477]MBE9064259.1 hypothetical protein [cf. Phormidesmis sp. LEGE 11477]
MPSPAERASAQYQNRTASNKAGTPGTIPSTPDDHLSQSTFIQSIFAEVATEEFQRAQLKAQFRALIKAAVQSYRQTGCLPEQVEMHAVVTAIAQQEAKDEAFQQRFSSFLVSPGGRDEQPVEAFDVLAWANTPAAPQLNRPAPRKTIAGGPARENC